MNQVELKSSLRKISFPECAIEAMKKIDSLMNDRVPNIKEMDFVMELMSEFVFCEIDRRGKKTNALNSIQEVQLIMLLCEYLSNESTSEITKNTVFLSLFSQNTLQQRLKTLCSLVSIAIGQSCKYVLVATAAWMQQFGCTSPSSINLAQSLVKDYFSTPTIQPCVQDMPKITPQFTANFLTALAQVYLADDRFTFPPDCVTKTVIKWITEQPSLCLTPLQNPISLPTGGIAMPAVTSLGGLFQWTILCELSYGKMTCERRQMFNELHLALLQSLVAGKRLSDATQHAISTKSFTNAIMILERCISQVDAEGKRAEKRDVINICLDRLGQAVQVSGSLQFLYGNVQELLRQMENLPEHQFIRIVIRSNSC